MSILRFPLSYAGCRTAVSLASFYFLICGVHFAQIAEPVPIPATPAPDVPDFSAPVPSEDLGEVLVAPPSPTPEPSVDPAVLSFTEFDTGAPPATVEASPATVEAPPGSVSEPVVSSEFTDLKNVVAIQNGFALRFKVPSLSAERTVSLQDASGEVALIGAGSVDPRYLTPWRNLADLTDAAQARENLGLVIGRNVAAWSTAIDDLADGELSGAVIRSGLRASSITEGMMAPERLGSGTASGETFLRGDGTWQEIENGGTVRSVGLRMPGIFAVDGSPIYRQGEFEVSLRPQPDGVVFAGPEAGEDNAEPGFRRLEAADLPEHEHSGADVVEGTIPVERLPEVVPRLDAPSSMFQGDIGTGSGGAFFFGSPERLALKGVAGALELISMGSPRLTLDTSGRLKLSEGVDVALGSADGTRIGVEPAQKLGFYGASPIAQPSGDVLAALKGLGLVKDPFLGADQLDSGTLADARLSWPISDLGKKISSMQAPAEVVEWLGVAPGRNVQPFSEVLTTLSATGPTPLGLSLLSASDVASARRTLDLTPGEDVQPFSTELAALSSGSSSAFGRTWLRVATPKDACKALGLQPGVDVQAQSKQLDLLASVASTETGRGLLGSKDAAVAQKILGLTPGTDIQPYNENLKAISAEKTTPFGRSLLAAADAGAARAALGSAPGRDVQAFDPDLAEMAKLTTTPFGRSLLATSDAETLLASIGGHDASRLAVGRVAAERLGEGQANGQTFLRGDGRWSSVAYDVGSYIKVWEEQEQGRPGGSFINGEWMVRALNRIEPASGFGVVLSATTSRVLLPPGAYRFEISAPARRVGQHQARLQDVTANQTIALGTSEYAGAADTSSQTRSLVRGRMVITQPTELEVQHRCSSPYGNVGFGEPAGWGPEIYTLAEFWREP